MWPFSTTETVEPAPVVDREAVALERVREIKAALNELDAQMLKFRNEHGITCDRFYRLLGVRCGLTERPAIETEWRALLRRRDKLMELWHTSLHELAELRRMEK